MKRLLLCVALVIALPGLWNAGVAHAASKPANNKPPHLKPPRRPLPRHPATWAPIPASLCHANIAKNFATNPHSKLALMHGGKGITCESCHGPGQAHVEGGGDITKIFLPTKGPPSRSTQPVSAATPGSHPNFERSPHAKAGLSCISCHSIHASQSEESLLKLPQPTLCFTCHTDVKGAFNMPFHHPVLEGVVKCTDCHDVHGTFQSSQLRSTADQNLICTKCHTDVRGPFVYEHAVVKGEGAWRATHRTDRRTPGC